jgi:cobalt transporter subunit CbtB
MTVTIDFSAASHSRLLPIVTSAIIGVFMIFMVGHLQTNVLHNAAHDTRHATGFPCH